MGGGFLVLLRALLLVLFFLFVPGRLVFRWPLSSPPSSTARMVPIAASSRSAMTFAIAALQPARFHQRTIELVGQPRAIRAERLDPARQFVLVAVGVTAALRRAFQRIERRQQPARRGVDIRR